jgi:hypothetical protein
MKEKVSFVRMETELRSKVEEYEQLIGTAYGEALKRSQSKRKLSEDEKQRAKKKASLIRLIAMGVSAGAAAIFYKFFFGW